MHTRFWTSLFIDILLKSNAGPHPANTCSVIPQNGPLCSHQTQVKFYSQSPCQQNCKKKWIKFIFSEVVWAFFLRFVSNWGCFIIEACMHTRFWTSLFIDILLKSNAGPHPANTCSVIPQNGPLCSHQTQVKFYSQSSCKQNGKKKWIKFIFSGVFGAFFLRFVSNWGVLS